MKLLSIELARSIWCGHVRDLNPRGKYLYIDILPFLLEQYKFKKYPSPQTDLDESKGLEFENGEFMNSQGERINIKLIIYNFGIIAESASSTTDTDIYLDTLLSQISDIFNLPHYENILTDKQYLSQIHVSTDKSLEFINPKLKKISDYLTKKVSGYESPEYQLGGLSFWPDQIKPFNPPPFSIERVVTVPFSKNRYISTCSLQTDEHLELLDEFENILS